MPPDSFEAIILAAGRGSRLGELGKKMPKGLVRIAGEAIVERSVRLLAKSGARRVIVVTGHLHEMYEKFFENSELVSLIFNPKFESSGSFESLRLGLRNIRGELPVLVLDSDIIYEPSGLEAILGAPDDAVLASGTTGLGDEVWVISDDFRIKEISKNRTKSGKEVSEFVGITRIGPTLNKQLADYCGQYPEAEKKEYEQVLDSLVSSKELYVKIEPELKWTEVDDVNQLQAARRIFGV